MPDHTRWYPPSLVFYPPELPVYLKDVYDLKPIVGVPNDGELIGIHSVIYTAIKVVGVPGMHDPSLFMKLSDHLFSVQMAKYQSKYSFITFPSDITYTPPNLPAHIPVKLEPIAGAPSDEEIIKVQDAVQSYQDLRRFPSMFDSQINMELSQHLFDLHMARHMRLAGEGQRSPVPQSDGIYESSRPVMEGTPDIDEESHMPTNNAGTGGSVADDLQISQPTHVIEVCDLMERSNRLTEQLNLLLERSNQLAEQHNRPAQDSSSEAYISQFHQILERLTQLVERSQQPTERSDQLTERFNQLFERFNRLVEQSNQPAQRANELAERSNELADRANQLAENLSRSSERSNQLAEQANGSVTNIGNLLMNINKVLVGVQHAIVRNHKGNTVHAIDCLVNEKGELLGLMYQYTSGTIKYLFTYADLSEHNCLVTVDGISQQCRIPDSWLGWFLRFYGICDHLRKGPNSNDLKDGKANEARGRLSDYLSSCLG